MPRWRREQTAHGAQRSARDRAFGRTLIPSRSPDRWLYDDDDSALSDPAFSDPWQ